VIVVECHWEVSTCHAMAESVNDLLFNVRNSCTPYNCPLQHCATNFSVGTTGPVTDHGGPPETRSQLCFKHMACSACVRLQGLHDSCPEELCHHHHHHVTQSSHSINAIGPAPLWSRRKREHCSIMFATITHIPSLHKILSNTPRNHPAPPSTTPNIIRHKTQQLGRSIRQ
jgi:hypothetical protein